MAVDDDETDGLLGDVVGRIHAGRGDELEVRFGVFAKALGHIVRLAFLLLTFLIEQAGCFLKADVDDLRLGLFERCPEIFRGEGFMLMDDLEHRLDGVKQLFAVGAGGRVRQRGEEFDIANQMGDAELHGDIEVLHELAVGREIVAAQGAVELVAQDLDQNLRAARLVDAEHCRQLPFCLYQ